MVLHRHLSSAQQLLHLAHTQAQQMLSLAYQQAQQMMTLAESQRFKPPSLVSKCKAHNRPACPLAPCSHILYHQSKVTCDKLRHKLVKNSWHTKDSVYPRINHPARTESSCTTQALQSDSCPPAQFVPKVRKSKLPLPIKPSSRSTHTSPLNCGSPMGEGKHPIKPTCMIKASRMAAALSRFSELTTLDKELTLESPSDFYNITQGSPVGKQPGAPLAPNPPPIPTIGAAALAQGGGPQHAGNNHLHVVQCSDSLLLMSGHPLPTPESLQSVQSSPRETLDTSSMTPPLLGRRSSGSTQPPPLDCGSPMGEGKHPNKPTCVIKASRTAAALSKFSKLKQTMASLNQLFTLQQKTLRVTSSSSSAPVTSLVEPDVEPSSTPLFPVLASAQLSTCLSPTVPSADDNSACDLATVSIEMWSDADPSCTPSHLRHLNHNLPYLSVYKAPRKALHSLGLAPQPPHLALEQADPTAINPQLLVAIQKAMEEKLYEDALAFHACCLSEPRADQNQVALLRRNCARLHLLQQNPQEALSLCNQILSADSEDVLAIQLEAETRRMLNAPSAVSS